MNAERQDESDHALAYALSENPDIYCPTCGPELGLLNVSKADDGGFSGSVQCCECGKRYYYTGTELLKHRPKK